MAIWLVVLLAVAVPVQMPAKTVKPPDVDYYTCTMHPSVRSQDPDGKCPICGMNLVPVFKKMRKPALASNGTTRYGRTQNQILSIHDEPARDQSDPGKRQHGHGHGTGL